MQRTHACIPSTHPTLWHTTRHVNSHITHCPCDAAPPEHPEHEASLVFRNACSARSIRASHTSEEIRRWFDDADTDGDGDLSVNEFFGWVLNKVSNTSGGAALEAAFRAYDKDGSGMLDYKEFETVAARMGFGSVAHSIFQSLDHDRSGSVSYKEIIGSVVQNATGGGNASSDVARLCTSLMIAYEDDGTVTDAVKMDTSNWVVRGRDVETIRSELQALLRASGAHVADLLRIFDQDHDCSQEIDDIEFCKAMREHLGFRGNGQLLLDVFKTLDIDNDGYIGFVRI